MLASVFDSTFFITSFRSKFIFLYNFIISLLNLFRNNSTIAYPGNLDPENTGDQYAFGENIGWINFKPVFGPGVTVTDTAVTGYAWAENIGWINLHPSGSGVVNDGYGHLSGYAWAENAGWINFAPIGGGVSIDAEGEFHGYAWGENIGWINFAPNGKGIKTSWRPGSVKISGGAYNFPGGLIYKASFSMDVTGPASPLGWLKYYYSKTRMNFASTGITGVYVVGSTATISGTGTVNSLGGYSFTAVVTDGSPDRFSIIIKKSDGSVYYSAGSLAVAGGDLIISTL